MPGWFLWQFGSAAFASATWAGVGEWPDVVVDVVGVAGATPS